MDQIVSVIEASLETETNAILVMRHVDNAQDLQLINVSTVLILAMFGIMVSVQEEVMEAHVQLGLIWKIMYVNNVVNIVSNAQPFIPARNALMDLGFKPLPLVLLDVYQFVEMENV